MATRKSANRNAVIQSPLPIPADTGIGDNSGNADLALPLPIDTHNAIETTLASIAKSEAAIEYARQKLSRLLEDRHRQIVADKPAGSVPFAHEMAINDAKRAAYLNELVTEFALNATMTDQFKAMSDKDRADYNAKTRARLTLALELFVRLDWHRNYTPGFVCVWNTDESRWYVSPAVLVPPGYTASTDLMMENGTARETIPLEYKGSALYFYVARLGRQPVTITTSLDQFNHVFLETLKVLRNPTQDTSTVEPTASRKRRAARQATVKSGAAMDAPDIATEDSDTPEATAPSAQGDRVWALGQFVRTIVAVEKFVEHDTLADMSWSDLPIEAYNAMQALRMLLDRMDAKADGKQTAPGVPDAPTTKSGKRRAA